MTRLRCLLFLAGLALILIFPLSAHAAEEQSKNLLTMIEDSGASGIAFLGVLGLFSIVAGTVAIERLVNMRRDKILPANLVHGLAMRVSDDEMKLEPYRVLCDANPSPMARILRAGLRRAGRPAAEVEKAMEDTMSREMAALRSSTRPLSIIGGVAPLVGLLGTVVGMIIAFHTASEQGLGGKAETLAKGIYLALLTTAAGLSIAIPSMLMAAFFMPRLETFVRETDEHLMEVVPLLTEMNPPRKGYWTEKQREGALTG